MQKIKDKPHTLLLTIILILEFCIPFFAYADSKRIYWATYRVTVADHPTWDTGCWDGVVLDPDGYWLVDVIKPTLLSVSDFDRAVANLNSLNPTYAKSNWIILNMSANSMSVSDMDWFDDTNWATAIENVKQFARLANTPFVDMIVIDQEHYAGKLFEYDSMPLKGSKTIEQYRAQAKLRAEQIINAIESVAISPKIGWVFDHADSQGGYVSTDDYDLLSGFINGIISAANPTTKLHSLNERAYLTSIRTYPLIRSETIFTFPLLFADDATAYEDRVQVSFGTLSDNYPSLTVRTEAELTNHSTTRINSGTNYVWFYRNIGTSAHTTELENAVCNIKKYQHTMTTTTRGFK